MKINNKLKTRLLAIAIAVSFVVTVFPSGMSTVYAAELEDTSEQVTEVTEEITEELTEDTTEEITEETTEELTEDTTEETTEEVIDEIIYEDDDPDKATANYLTFTAAEEESTISFSWVKGSSVQYSLDGGETWKTYSMGTTITLDNIGDSVKFKGTNVQTNKYDANYNEIDKHFFMTGKIKASGSVTSLTDGNGGNVSVTLSKECYADMFSDCTSLIEAPELPAKTLADYCYMGMFDGCTSLTKGPQLPAKTLADSCYIKMFAGCSSLIEAPELPALYVKNSCYLSMFEKCTSLEKAPELPADMMEPNCYYGMFDGCTSLKEAPKLPAFSLEWSCYAYMFSDCTSLEKAPELPSKVAANQCYSGMFNGCTSLKTAPKLPAETLDDMCYFSMFAYCTSLETAPELRATELQPYCYSLMFMGCTSLTNAPSLRAKMLSTGCYSGMFYECEKLTKAPELPAAELAESCYDEMFMGCTSLQEVSNLPAEELEKKCYNGMFNGCTSLKKPPVISATITAESSCENMFKDCTSLQEVPKLNAWYIYEKCYYGMFEGCKSLSIKKTKDANHGMAWSIPSELYGYARYWNYYMFDNCPNVEIDEPEPGVVYYQQHTHTVVIDEAVPATCTKSGLTEGKHCSSCGEVLVEQKYVTVGHNMKAKITKATFWEDGIIEYTCSTCGYVGDSELLYGIYECVFSKDPCTYDGKEKKPTVQVLNTYGSVISPANYTVTYDSDCKKVGKHKVTISMIGNYYYGAHDFYYVINPKKTSIKSIKAGTKSITLKWAKQTAEVSGYEIQYSTDGYFSNSKKITVTSSKTTSKVIKKLKSGKKYYVRIRTYKKVGGKKYYSAWSAKKSIKVK